MSLAFYMDHNVHASITAGLRRRGIDRLTAQEDGMSRAGDPLILERATHLDRVLFTHDDDDLLAISCEWQRRGLHFSGVVYGRQLSVTIGQAIRDLQLISAVLSSAEMRNSVEHLPL